MKMNKSNLRNVVWEYFDRKKIKDELLGICKIGTCKQAVKCPTGTTSGMLANLSSAHPKIHKDCERRTDQARQIKAVEKELAENNKSKQRKVDDMMKGNCKGKGRPITDAIGRMIAFDMLPYDFVEGKGFKLLIKLLALQYLIPSGTTFSRTVLPELHKSVKEKNSCSDQSGLS